MSEQNKVEQPVIHEKISIKDLDFDNLDIDELIMIKDEIDVVLNIRKLIGERLEYVKKQLVEEKEELRNKMLKEIKKEKERLRQETEEEESSAEEAIVYNKKTPKGKVTRRKAPAKKK